MNQGKINKKFHSPNNRVSDLITQAVSQWPHGYGEHTLLLAPSDEPNSWIIEIPEHFTNESTLILVDAYLHVGCGFSYFDNDSATMLEWQESGDNFEKIVIKAPRKELAHELWEKLSKVILEYNIANREVQSAMITIVGSSMPLDQVKFYSDITNSLGLNSFINTCFFEDSTEKNHIILHISSTHKASSQNLSPYLDVPDFLKR
ncbi:hypothetical protein FCV87_17105 [Vibrio breoganii]|uniref:hypothetical protein n=1 Tax=Vibrio breoganii TaxID=553239 RepID=UPI0010BCF988|nr:hypothetical protein [Vibrio breoganii]TKG25124.1 hypothetical protein FCV87_17105 [Vibrio breoganii]